MNPFAIVWTIIITIIFSLPFSTSGIPWNTTGGDGDGKFSWVDVNYAPLTVIFVLLVVGIWWKVSAHKYFTGQVRQVDIEEALHEREDEPRDPDPPAGGTGTTPPTTA
jgi:hypothetical protein